MTLFGILVLWSPIKAVLIAICSVGSFGKSLRKLLLAPTLCFVSYCVPTSSNGRTVRDKLDLKHAKKPKAISQLLQVCSSLFECHNSL
jgi:hypothetical protein